MVLRAELFQVLDRVVDVCREDLQLLQRLNGVVLGRRPVVLHALQVADDVLRVLLLLIDDRLQRVVLVVHLREDLVLEAHLVGHSLLHLLAIVQTFFDDSLHILKLRY